MRLAAMGTLVNKVKSWFSLFFYHFQNFTWLFKHCTTQGPTQNFSWIESRCGFTYYNRSLVLVLVWCSIEILIEALEKAEKCWKLCEMAFSPHLLVFPWQQWTCKQMFEHSLGNCDILPLSRECKMHELRNFKFSEIACYRLQSFVHVVGAKFGFDLEQKSCLNRL